MIDTRLSLAISHADGRTSRWGPGEAESDDIPDDGLTFSTSIPGGDRDLSCALLRRIDTDWPDLELFNNVRCYGAGQRTAFQGRMQQFPRSHGDQYQISPSAVGLSAHLRDDPSFVEVYVDRSISSWGDIPLSRKNALATANVSFGDFSFAAQGATNQQLDPARRHHGVVTTTTPGTALVAALPNQALGTATIAEARYTMPAGREAATVRYKTQTTWFPAGWTSKLITSSSDSDYTGAETYTFTNDSTIRAHVLSTARRYLTIQVYSNGNASTPAAGANWNAAMLAVYGNHGLTSRAITSEPDGFYASDVIADVVSRAAPLLTYTTGSSGSIQPTTFAIPHLAFRDPTTAADAIDRVNAYHIWDHGVYDGEFFFREPDPDRLLWEARLSDGAQLDFDGDTGEQVINGVFVTYAEPTGEQKTVGPPGGSFDATDSALQDTSSTNPANANGIPRKWTQLTLSFPTTQSGATAIGAAYLAERSLAGRRGSVTLTGTATHPTEGKVPAWRVRAGDWVTLKDLTGATVPRKIINTSYGNSGKTVRLDLDNTVAKLDAILERVGILTGIATGGGF